VVQLRRGRLIMPVAIHTDQDHHLLSRGSVTAYLSDDSGRTWRRSGTVASPKTTPRHPTKALRCATIGILRQAYERESADPEIVTIFMTAIEDLRRAGATIVDPATVDPVRRERGAGPCQGFKYDLNHFFG
jgi:Asp-tRNA(Asn)/Glu-tRNA(Gln) amidotransferase A subunit family amidase